MARHSAASKNSPRCQSEQPLYRNFTARVMYAAVQVFTGETPPKPLLESMQETTDTHFLLIAAGANEREVAFNEMFGDTLGARAALWIAPDTPHTGALQLLSGRIRAARDGVFQIEWTIAISRGRIAMADLKTKPTDQSVEDFLNAIPDDQKRADAFAILKLMKQVTRAEPVMWGSIVGFGRYHYKYASGRRRRLVSDRILTAQAKPHALSHVGRG